MLLTTVGAPRAYFEPQEEKATTGAINRGRRGPSNVLRPWPPLSKASRALEAIIISGKNGQMQQSTINPLLDQKWGRRGGSKRYRGPQMQCRRPLRATYSSSTHVEEIRDTIAADGHLLGSPGKSQKQSCRHQRNIYAA